MREAFRQQGMLRDRCVLERLVKPGDHACVVRHGFRDPADVVEEQGSVAFALSVVEAGGKCVCAVLVHVRRRDTLLTI